MSISEMIERVELLAKKEIGTGASDQDIARVERELGVCLPASYRSYLSKFGWAEIRYDALYGIGPSVPPPYELVRHVLLERTECEPSIPHHLIPIMNDGAGNHYCLDTSRFDGDECPIVFWDHEHWDGPDQTPDVVSSSFDRWLVDRMTNGPHSDNV